MDQLLSLDPQTGTPPKSRIGSAQQAYNIVYQYIQNDSSRSRNRASIDGMFDGNAPYTSDELNKKNRRDAVNINWRQGGAMFNMVKGPYYNLWTEIPVIGIPTTDIPILKDEESRWIQVIAEENHKMVNAWSKWEFIKQNHQNVMIKHGIGFVFWPDDKDWRPDSGQAGDLYVADGAPSNIEELEVVVMTKAYTADQLYAFIENEEIAKASGWNIEETRKAIIQAYHGGDNPPAGAQTWEWYQSKLKEADIYAGGYMFDRVFVAHVLVREFKPFANGNQISMYILRYDSNDGAFLYESKEGKFKTMSQAVCPFFYDIGTGKWHSINGLGKEIYPFVCTFNRMLCEMLQAAQIAGSAILQPDSATTAQQAQMITFGGMTLVPPGFKIVEHSIGTNIAAVRDTITYMQQQLINNVGSLMKSPAPPKRQGQKIQIMEMSQQGELMKTSIYRYYPPADFMLSEMMRRAAVARADYPGGREAVEMRKRCEDRGVPREFWKHITGMRMYRSLGAGSAANEQMKLDAAKEMLSEGFFPPEGKIHVEKMIASRVFGTDETQIIFGRNDEQEEEKSNDSIAAMENNFLRMGMPVEISQGQDDVIHATIHLDDVALHMKQAQAQAQQEGQWTVQNLSELSTHMQGAAQHVRAHLDRIKDSKIWKSDYDELNKRWQQMTRAADQVLNNLKEMQQKEQTRKMLAGPPQPQFDPDVLKTIDKDMPESVKQKIYARAGAPADAGDVSVATSNTRIKDAQLQLKAEKEKRMRILDDLKGVQMAKANAQPQSNGATNGLN